MENFGIKKNNRKYSPRPLVLGIIFIILILTTFRVSYIEPNFRKEQIFSESVPPFTILLTGKGGMTSATREGLEVLASLLIHDGFEGKGINLALGDADGRRASVVIKPSTEVPLSYFEVQRIARAIIREHIPRPNTFIEEGYTRLLASKIMGMDPHRFTKAILDASTITPLTDAILVEGVRVFTPRARFQSESFVAYLQGEKQDIKELLEYTSRNLISKVVLPFEDNWRSFLAKHSSPISIKELRSFLIDWDKLFRDVATSIRVIYPTTLKPISLLYREAIHYVEVMNRSEFEKTNSELTTLLGRMPQPKEERTVWSLPKYWDFLRTWLVAILVLIFSFWGAKRLKSVESRVYLMLLGGFIGQAYTFFFLHIGVSFFIELSLLIVGLIFILYFLVDEAIYVKPLPPTLFTSLFLPLIPFPLLWMSLKISGYPYFEGFLLVFALIAVLCFRLLEPEDMGLTLRGMNLLIPITLLMLANYYFLPVKYQFDLENFTNFGIYTIFHLGWATWCFTIFFPLLKRYTGKNLLFLLAPAAGFLGELMLRTPLLITEAVVFWLTLSFIFWLTRSLPVLWGLVLARSVLLHIFLPEPSPLILLPYMGITAITILVIGVTQIYSKRRSCAEYSSR